MIFGRVLRGVVSGIGCFFYLVLVERGHDKKTVLLSPCLPPIFTELSLFNHSIIQIFHLFRRGDPAKGVVAKYPRNVGTKNHPELII